MTSCSRYERSGACGTSPRGRRRLFVRTAPAAYGWCPRQATLRRGRYLARVLLQLLTAGSFFERWWNDPVASTTVFVAIAAGSFGLYRFRFVPRERRRETLDAMQKSYKLSRVSRDEVLPAFPPFLSESRDALLEAVVASGPTRSDLLSALESWPEPISTAAHEIIRDEAKFRVLLLAIANVRRFEDASRADDETRALLRAALTLVAQLNDFAQLVELDLFSQGDVLGQLHRSLASACKAVEPLIWARNLDGRWGLRVLRLLVRAEHYNDVRRIHRTSSLVWRRSPQATGTARVVIRPSWYRDDYGKLLRNPGRDGGSRTARVFSDLDGTWAGVRQKYGGRRLTQHRRYEGVLVGRLRYAVDARLDPLDMSWDMASLEAQLARHWEARVGPAADNA
jgi:hypothetical protein